MALGTLDPPPRARNRRGGRSFFGSFRGPACQCPCEFLLHAAERGLHRARPWLGDPFSGVSGGLSRCLEPIQDEKHIVGLTCGFGWIWSSIHREVRTPTLAKQLIPRQVQVTCRTASTMLHMDRFSGYATICLGLDATL